MIDGNTTLTVERPGKRHSMIMRTWRGAVKAEDAYRYLEHQAGTGVREYRETPGNVGALVLRRSTGELIRVTTVSLWTSMEAVEGFAGQNPERAKFYPGDDELPAEKATRTRMTPPAEARHRATQRHSGGGGFAPRLFPVVSSMRLLEHTPVELSGTAP